jgi:outer membrane receptor protein involved in Fe transport
LLVTLAVASFLSPLFAADDDPAKEKVKVTETMTVTGKVTPPKDEVSPDIRTYPAKAEILTQQEIRATSARDAGEVLRSLPGVDYVYYGQGGIPSGPSVRGYTDRNFGQDMAGFLDGIPLNLPGFVASHGAMDLTPIFPEAVERVELIRGPFDARYGDFQRGASLDFVTRDGIDHPSLSMALGSYGSKRVVGSYGNWDPAKPVSIYANLDYYDNDGYANNQKVQHLRSFNKLYFPMARNDVTLTIHYFDSDWDAPSYLDVAKLKAGTVSDKLAINKTDGGDLTQGLLALRYRIDAASKEPWVITLYGTSRDWTRFRHDSLISATQTQVRQMDRRDAYGYRVEKSFARPMMGRQSHLIVGTDLHRDDAATQQDRTLLRQVIGTTDRVDELLTNAGIYAQEHIKLAPWLKMSAGLRYTWFDYDIFDHYKAKGTYVDSFSDSKLDPKLGFVVTPNDRIEAYVQYATGMRTPTPRTEVRNSISSIDRVKIASTVNHELGLTFRPAPRIELRGDVWRATNSNEIRGIPPGGVQFESLGKSRRNGWDGDVSVIVGQKTVLYGGYSRVSARLLTPATAGAVFLPDIPENVGQLGFHSGRVIAAGELQFDGDASWYSKRPLNTTGTLYSDAYERVTAHVGFQPNGAPWRVWGKAVDYPGSRIGESEFLFGSTLGARPVAAFTLELGAAYQF